MPTSLQFALSNPTVGMEEEFVRWYGTDHLIHGVEVPGILAGQCFRRVNGPLPSGKHDYLMIWEFDDPAYALEQLALVRGGDEMPISPAIDMATVQPPTMWLRSTVRNAAHIVTDTSERGPIVLGLYNAADGEDEAFVDAIMHGELAALADLPGVIAASFMTLTDEQIRGNARKYPYGILVELADQDTGLEALAAPLSALPHADRERWLAPVFQPVSRRIQDK